MSDYIRWVGKNVVEALKTRRVIIVSGARQVGKTTLMDQLNIKDVLYRTLDDNVLLKSALDDPQGFLTHTSSTMIIDEIQKAPILIPEIKRIVDRNNQTGQFILIGSANIKARPEVRESLAGRVKNIRLKGITEGEILGRQPNFIEKIYKKKFPDQIKGCTKNKILEIALRGSYPEAVRLDKKYRKDWYKDYLNTLLNQDLKELVNIRRFDALKKIVKILAAWSSKYIDMKSICSSCELTRDTINTYINLIEGLYLCERVLAWGKSVYDRAVKKDKFYFADSGLMASILNWHYDNVVLDPDKYGKLIETFVFNEIKTQIDLSYDYSLYHYRDRVGHEIDLIIEDENENLVGIEIKGGSSVSKDDFKHMVWFKNNLVKDNKKFIGIILYSGENTIRFSKDMIAVPTEILWS